jgi:NAD(P)-dependent dehydrogenase (short-subunit alcohol dehydrogenase family)
MKSKVLVVTGGSRGIGAAVCRLAATRGYGVVVNYAENVAAAEAVCHDIHAAGGKAAAVRGDVSRPEDVAHIFAAADRLGTVTGLVNNAGIILPAARLEDMDAERLARTFAVNIAGAFLCAAAAIRRMSKRHGGQGGGIVNLSSGASKLGGADVYLDYAASKGAIDTFTVGLALEVAAEGIRVNAVRPGVIATDIHAFAGDPGRVERMAAQLPMPRAGTADEVATAILWLLSDEASYTTGTTIAVSGGRAILP